MWRLSLRSIQIIESEHQSELICVNRRVKCNETDLPKAPMFRKAMSRVQLRTFTVSILTFAMADDYYVQAYEAGFIAAQPGWFNISQILFQVPPEFPAQDFRSMGLEGAATQVDVVKWLEFLWFFAVKFHKTINLTEHVSLCSESISHDIRGCGGLAPHTCKNRTYTYIPYKSIWYPCGHEQNARISWGVRGNAWRPSCQMLLQGLRASNSSKLREQGPTSWRVIVVDRVCIQRKCQI